MTREVKLRRHRISVVHESVETFEDWSSQTSEKGRILVIDTDKWNHAMDVYEAIGKMIRVLSSIAK